MSRRTRKCPKDRPMTALKPAPGNPLDPAKFKDPAFTAAGERRAAVALSALKTLWFNTGTLCNLTCENCYIESSPTNDRLVYLTPGEVAAFLDEIQRDGWPVAEIAFTGGEPFMNPGLCPMLEDALERSFRALVLTNAMRPMMKCAEPLLALQRAHGDRLCLRVSLDHYDPALHELVRGKRSWQPAIDGLKWLSANGFHIHVAARACWNEPDATMRAGFTALFRQEGIRVDTADPVRMMILPEMNATLDVPEITEQCWSILGVSPEAMMCASSRMVVKRKGAARPVVVPCTLLPYDEAFDMGPTLADASGAVPLNHPHCARFCVLGGGACSRSAG
jgi:sulfatase maturation enzyme AslB (radical SAM superfamily)